MVFLSEASIRDMVQEALGGGGYPSLDGDGNFPIVPSPLAEPIVTKLALQPVRVMRVPTDRHQFELAVKELVDGVEQDHLPTLFLKLRELVSDFSPPTQQSSPCPEDCGQDPAAVSSVPAEQEMNALRAEVRRMIMNVMTEADGEKEEDPLAQWRPGGKRYIPSRSHGLAALPRPLEKDEPEDITADDDWEDLDPMDDVGLAEPDPADDPYPPEYLADPGYPDIGEDPDYQTWDDLEREISKSAWEPGTELDKFRGRSADADWEAVDDALEQSPEVKPKEAKGGIKTWEEIAVALGYPPALPGEKQQGIGALHGAYAIGARKLAYIGDYLGFASFNEFYENTTDKYIEFLINAGAEKDPETGKPNLSMADVMELRAASKLNVPDRSLDPEAEAARRAIQELDGFREFLNIALEHEMKLDGYAVSHKDAAKDKDRFSVAHRMKRTTR